MSSDDAAKKSKRGLRFQIFHRGSKGAKSKPKSTSKDVHTSREYRSFISGINPSSFEPDDDQRTDLFDRLRKFYFIYDAPKITLGIGKIVDWTIREGEEKLNKVLLEEYSANLETLAADEEASIERNEPKPDDLGSKSNSEDDVGSMATSARRNGSKALRKLTHTSPLEAFRQVATGGSKRSQAAKIEEKIKEFYAVHDPGRGETVLKDVLEYVRKRGITALNSKLYKKYGAKIEMFESLSEYENYTKSRSRSRQTFADLYMESTGIGKSSRRGSREAVSGSSNKDPLPDYIRPVLEMFYAVYDPTKLRNDEIKWVYKWTQKNGVEKLDGKLKSKYKEGFNEFLDRTELLQSDLISFFAKLDPHAISDGPDKILKWGLRNGLDHLNERLRDKYGYDLTSDLDNVSPAPMKGSIFHLDETIPEV